MEIIENTGQSFDFNRSYIVTSNYILLFDAYVAYKEKLSEIQSLEGYGSENKELYFNFETKKFYLQ